MSDILHLVGMKNNDTCEGCGEKENVKHMRLKGRYWEKVANTGQEWSH